MPQAAAIWDQRYSRNPEEVDRLIQYEPWLNRWQPVIAGCPGRALDLGCGPGYDTEVLLKWGCKVMAVDLSSAAIALSQARNPKATHWVMDVRSLRGFPGTFDLVIASLSLHYFNRKETESIFNSINGLLKPGGYFAFRVNAFDDVESGAPANSAGWESVSVAGVVKQFFTYEKITHVLNDNFRILSREKLVTYRYGHKKSLFEVIAQKHKK